MGTIANLWIVGTLKNVAKQDIPADARICRIVAKGKNKKLAESMAVVVSCVGNNVAQSLMLNEVGAEWMRGKIEELQDGMIRKQVEGGADRIQYESINIDAMLAAMKADNAATRFSKESIAAWFDADLREVLGCKILEKMTGLDQKTLDKMLDNYKSLFQVCAEREANRSMAADVKGKLIRAMEFLPEDYESATAERIMEILPTIPAPETMLAAL